MVYINSNGEVVDKEPITWKTPLKFIWKIISFIVEFFLTLFGLENKWRSSSINRYFMGSSGYNSGNGPDDGFGGGGGGGGRGPRKIATLPKYGGVPMSTCPGGSCGR